ncbi:MAG TPA: GNAT family N-acetyltransferase [Streptosporangiaceae bacterium]|nr:GNAT family N-acetyltransferase [Streptosporangiaceae bacterium]
MGDIDLILITREQASRIAAAKPGEQDSWAEGFPREDDSGPAALLARAAADPGPFGVYLIVPRTHGRVIGSAGFFGPPDASGEVTIGYGMVEPEWGNGYGTASVAGLIKVCRDTGRVTAINADTDPDNIASQRVLEKNGFARVRTTGDKHYFRLPINEHQR